MLIKALKSLFKFEDGIDLSRRKVIKGAAALAALTVVGINIPSLLKVKEIEEQLAGGRVYGQTFYLTETIVIDIPNVVIDNCKFIAEIPLSPMIYLKEGAHNCVIQNSSFTNKGEGIGVMIDPQGGVAMTTTFQSVIDMSTESQTIYLPKGEYKI